MLKAEKVIRDTISEHNLIEKGDHIVIGLSGGPDSVCLFHCIAWICIHVMRKMKPLL